MAASVIFFLTFFNTCWMLHYDEVWEGLSYFLYQFSGRLDGWTSCPNGESFHAVDFPYTLRSRFVRPISIHLARAYENVMCVNKGILRMKVDGVKMNKMIIGFNDGWLSWTSRRGKWLSMIMTLEVRWTRVSALSKLTSNVLCLCTYDNNVTTTRGKSMWK